MNLQNETKKQSQLTKLTPKLSACIHSDILVNINKPLRKA